MPDDLADARADMAAAFHAATASHWRNVGTVTARGGNGDDWRMVTEELPCRLTTASGGEEAQGGGLAEQFDFVLHCAADVDIRPRDQVCIGGKTYDVVHTDGGRTDAIAQHVTIAYNKTGVRL